MINKISNLNDIDVFTDYLISKFMVFHPDDEFTNYINIETNELSFTMEEANKLNDLMSECFKICEANGVDIYDYMLERALNKTVISSFIPLPSATIN